VERLCDAGDLLGYHSHTDVTVPGAEAKTDQLASALLTSFEAVQLSRMKRVLVPVVSFVVRKGEANKHNVVELTTEGATAGLQGTGYCLNYSSSQ